MSLWCYSRLRLDEMDFAPTLAILTGECEHLRHADRRAERDSPGDRPRRAGRRDLRLVHRQRADPAGSARPFFPRRSSWTKDPGVCRLRQRRGCPAGRIQPGRRRGRSTERCWPGPSAGRRRSAHPKERADLCLAAAPGMFDEPEAQTVAFRFCDAMDGWMVGVGALDGAVVIRAGHHYEPTATIGPDEAIGYTWQPFRGAGSRRREPASTLPVCSSSAAYDYTQLWIRRPGRTTPTSWSNSPALSQPFQPDMAAIERAVVRRPAKRKLTRLTTHNETLTLKALWPAGAGRALYPLATGGDEVDELEDIALEKIGDS